MSTGWKEILMDYFIFWKRGTTGNLVAKVDRIDKQGREVKHDLNNVAFKADALRALVAGMREDDAWRRESQSDG